MRTLLTALTLLAFAGAGLAQDEATQEKVTTALQRKRSVNNLKQIGLALHNYHSAYNAFPAAAICDKDGKPLLSWRVAILPFIEEDRLYKEFKLDEPWDSENNKKLLERMPKVYAPVRGKTKDEHATFYRVFQGGGALFDQNKPVKIQQITDGTSNTIMAVEAGEAVPWTKPDELDFDAKKELPKLGGLFDGNFHVLLADGSVRMMPKKFNADVLKKMITRAGGEVIQR